MSNSEIPKVPAPFDEHPETPLSGGELDIADADRKAAETKRQEAEFKRIREEPETPEERQFRLAQLRELRDRYGGDKAA